MKARKLLGIILLASVAIVGCNKVKDLETKVYEKTVVEAAAPGAPDSLSVNVKLEYPVAGTVSTALTKMVSTIVGRSFEGTVQATDIESAVEDYVDSTLKSYKTTYAEISRKGEEGTDSYIPEMSWEDNISGEFVGFYKNFASYLVTAYSYEGGANGLSGVIAMVFDTATGEIVPESRFFKEGVSSEVAALLSARLEESMPDAESYETLFVKDIAPNGNFYVSDKGVTYLYNPMDIGPHSLGTICVTLPWEDVTKYVAQ